MMALVGHANMATTQRYIDPRRGYYGMLFALFNA